MNRNRVVLTGMGVVSPVGIGTEPFWESLLAGRSGIGRITHFDPERYACQIAGEVKDFDPSMYIDKKEVKRMDRFTQFALAASKMAVEDSGLDFSKEDTNRIGVYIGTGIGGIETLHSQIQKLFEKGPHFVSPFFIPMMIGNLAAGQVSIAYGLHGSTLCTTTACTSGTNAIGDAFRLLQSGEASVMLAGGAEASISPMPLAGFCSMKALCTTRNDEPERASRPFDKERSGFVMGEGSGIVVMETLEHAEARGAKIYAEIAGYGRNSDAYHVTSPAPHGEYQAKCMSLAISDAGMTPDEIDYVNAHGTSTHMNDRGETEAIKEVFGAHSKDVLVSSIKSMTGHLLGAAGAVECISTALSIRDGIIPPTINYETVDTEEGLDLDYVPNKARRHEVKAAISNSFGFGGHNGCLLLKKG